MVPGADRTPSEDLCDWVISVLAYLCSALGTGAGITFIPCLLWKSFQPGVGEVLPPW